MTSVPCSICGQLIEEDHIKSVDSLNFCPDHYKLYKDNTWIAITNQKTSADTPDAGIYIYNFKEKLWNEKQIPSFIVTSYEIEDDMIYSFVKLFVLESDAKNLKCQLSLSK